MQPWNVFRLAAAALSLGAGCHREVVRGEPPDTTYLSDLPYTYATNGWGPIEKDQSIGLIAEGDGRPITLNGKRYFKGLGVHAPSDVRYRIDGHYARLITDIGLDDEIDGQYSNADHADWGGAELLSSSGARVWVSDLPWSFSRNGWGPVEKDHSIGDKAPGDGKPITLNRRVYEKGLGVHTRSEIRYRLDGKYARFRSDVGVDDEVGRKGSVVFQVFGDGTKLFDSGLMIGSSPTQTIDVGVQQVTELRLVVDTPLPGAVVFQVWGDGAKLYQSRVINGGSKTETIDLDIEHMNELRLVALDGDNDIFCDHADWADARLVAARR